MSTYIVHWYVNGTPKREDCPSLRVNAFGADDALRRAYAHLKNPLASFHAPIVEAQA